MGRFKRPAERQQLLVYSDLDLVTGQSHLAPAIVIGTRVVTSLANPRGSFVAPGGVGFLFVDDFQPQITQFSLVMYLLAEYIRYHIRSRNSLL